MSLTFPDDTVKKPSEVTPLPSSLKRPAFGTLYGFDASGVGGGGAAINGVLKTESDDFLLTESGDYLAFDE